jgi:hypothetical protein
MFRIGTGCGRAEARPYHKKPTPEGVDHARFRGMVPSLAGKYVQIQQFLLADYAIIDTRRGLHPELASAGIAVVL